MKRLINKNKRMSVEAYMERCAATPYCTTSCTETCNNPIVDPRSYADLAAAFISLYSQSTN